MSQALPAGLLLAVVAAGCGAGGELGPPEILYGQDICDRCRMVISEERHAAGAHLGGRELRFDDPGCLREFLDAEGRAGEATSWVHDETAAWVPVSEAWVVIDPQGGTPMASGILAFGSAEAAEDAGARFETVARRWDGLGQARQGDGP